MKLVQKRLFDTREFEIEGDLIHVRIKTPFRQEKLTVVLSVINPEPRVNGPCLEFRSRVRNDEPLLSLYLKRPDSESFERFVDALKLRIRDEYSAFTGLRAGSRPEGLAANSYDEPPDFGERKKPAIEQSGKPVSVASIDTSIRMLRQHLDGDEIIPLLAALEALRSEPENDACFDQLVNAFEQLGSSQGAVLTYAPYVSVLLSDDPFAY